MNSAHGGDVTGYTIRYGHPPLDFSASLNPLGMPAAVRDAARKAIDASFAYPDPFCRKLVHVLAARLNVSPGCLFIGNGAADVIYRLVHAVRPRAALVTAPTFAEYELALKSVECRVERYCLSRSNHFVLDPMILDKITNKLDILFLCQPNNPTGLLAAPDLVAAILERCARSNVLLFVDECFCHFVDEPEKYSLIRHLRSFPNLFILDSFTKLYGMAGIRLGYGVSSDETLMNKLAASGQCWPVSTVAQEAGLAALAEKGFVKSSRRVVQEARRSLVDGLRNLNQDVIGGDANFLFFHSPLSNLDALLAEKGILIRNCVNFYGLEPGYFRIAVRLEEENQLLLTAMAEIMNGEPWPRR